MNISLHTLSADCSRCHSYCCIAPRIRPEHGFPFHKPALTPCCHLISTPFSCQIHADLAAQGCHGCVDFTCHGAGPLIASIAQQSGRIWSQDADGRVVNGGLLEPYLEVHGLLSALVDLRALAAEHSGLHETVLEVERRIEALQPAQLLGSALELAFEIRGICWGVDNGDFGSESALGDL